MITISSIVLQNALQSEKEELLEAVNRCIQSTKFDMAEKHLKQVSQVHNALKQMEVTNGNREVQYELLAITHSKAEAPPCPITDREAFMLYKGVPPAPPAPLPPAPAAPLPPAPAAIPRDPDMKKLAPPAPPVPATTAPRGSWED